MPRKLFIHEDFVFDVLSFQRFCQGETNSIQRKQMMSILQKAMKQELTETQLLCVVEYYINGKKMKDIARDLGKHPSTVTRCIKRAKKKLAHIAEYY